MKKSGISNLPFIMNLINYFQSGSRTVDIAGRPSNQFFSRLSSTGAAPGTFKHNQRKERLLSRRRKMKPSAR